MTDFYAVMDARKSRPTIVRNQSQGTTSNYGAAALERELGRVATAPEGTRNDTLNRAAFALGQLMAGGEVDETTATDQLTTAARRAGLDDTEITQTIGSGIKAGKLEPRSADGQRREITLTNIRQAPVEYDTAENAEPSEARRAVATPASSIKTRAQQWFWRDRIPTGTITAFAGRGGEGKSSFAFHIATEVSKGTLPGHLEGRPRNVLIWSGEDEWSTVVIPRLMAAGADLERVHKLGIESVVDAETLEVSPNLPDDLSLIGKAISDTDAALVIIDPISSTMKGDLNKEADTRRTLDGLARIAHRTGAVVLAIRHFNKGGGNASDKMSGSHAFRDAARSVFLFAHDSETDQRIISQDKGNYSQHAGGSLAFALESTDVITDDGNTADVARVVMLGESDVSVSDVINRNPFDEEGDDRNAAQAFVLDYLEGQPNREAPAGQVIKAGRAAGFNETELKNARKRSRNPKIRSQKSGFGGGWVWVIEPDLDLEGVTKVSKVSLHRNTTPSTSSMTPSQNTCVICRQKMIVSYPGQTTHPGCEAVTVDE